MLKNSFIENTYVVGTHWNCLIEAIPMCTSPYVTENKEENYWKFTFTKYHAQCLYLFKTSQTANQY